MDPVGRYLFLNNTLTTPTNYGPVGGSATVTINNGEDFPFGYTLAGQPGFIVITLVFVNGRKTVTLTNSGTWNLPADWNDADNVIEVYGGGGNGATSGSTSQSGGGGGGGGYVRATNVPLKASDLAGYVTAKTYDSSGLWQGFQRNDSDTGDPLYGYLVWGQRGQNASGIFPFNYLSPPQAYINNVNYATIAYFGGSGGVGRLSSTAAGGGGGGAAGPNGQGGAGGGNTSTLGTTGRGGGGGNGGGAGSSTSATGGTAGTGAGAGGNGGGNGASGFAGGLGTSVYSGGGGGGAGDGANTLAGAGGGFGGGGGGSGSATSSVGGVGAPGIILISYIPITNLSPGNFFLFF
jgi:hypothetical protein